MRTLPLAAALVVSLAAESASARPDATGPVDAFLSSFGARALASDPGALAEQGIRLAHSEPRYGVPTFVFAESERFPAAAPSPEAAARQHLLRLASLYRLDSATVERLRNTGLHDTGKGAVIASFGAAVNGIEVFRHEIDVVMNPALELVAISGYLPPSSLPSTGKFALGHEEAIARAFAGLTGAELPPALLLPEEGQGRYRHFTLAESAESLLGWRFVVPARAKEVYFALPERLVPAYYVELNVDDANSNAPYVSFVLDAEKGTLLFRNDLTAHAFTSYRVFADTTPPYIPWDSPLGNASTPHPTGVPDGFTPLYVPSNIVSLDSAPFSRMDPWLPPLATETRGNNVDAYADLVPPDGFQPGFDRRAPATGSAAFLHDWSASLGPQDPVSQLDAAVTHLFFVTNFLHDWFYDAGFDERAGNAQMSNYGRGGLQGDALRAEAQDYADSDYADMATPADGGQPRMQLYLWNGTPRVTVTAPWDVAGSYPSNHGLGPRDFDLTADLVVLNPNGVELGCAPLPANQVAGKILLLDRGDCDFADKARNARDAGAVALIIANNVPGSPNVLGGDAPDITIPVVPISLTTGALWKSQVAAQPSVPLVLRLHRNSSLDRDGTLDSTLIAHEWGHMISNRLIGDANGLNNRQGRALGEGWGDFHALLLMVRNQDLNVSTNWNWFGSYAVAVYAASAGSGDATYYGLRRVPYSTDMTKNGLLFDHIAQGASLPSGLEPGKIDLLLNSEVHNAGEVWATMLWECYVSLLRAHPFQEAQDRMKNYLVAAYKATPVMPTFLEARDALLAVANANDPADGQRFIRAFATRGAGYGARAPARESMDFIGVSNGFSATTHLSVLGVTLDDSIYSCDKDGILDQTERGLLRLTLLNDGANQLSASTVTVTDLTNQFTFPSGNSVYYPSLRPNQSATIAIPVALNQPMSAPAVLEFAFADPSLPADVRTFSEIVQGHVDVKSGVSAYDDDIGGRGSAWTLDRGWSQRIETGKFAHGEAPGQVSDSSLTTPWIAVRPDQDFSLTLSHRYSFENDNGQPPLYDGGVIEYSLDGITWHDVLDAGIHPGYTGMIELDSPNPLAGRAVFGGMSNGFPAWTNTSLHFGRRLAGHTVKFRFRIGTDAAVSAWGWDIATIQLEGSANLPFGALLPETSDGSLCNHPPLAIAGDRQMVWEGGFDADGQFERTTVTLDGSASFDPEGAPLEYRWSQIAGTPVILSAPQAAVTTFQPVVPQSELLTFELVVSDGIDESLPALVDVHVTHVNRPPIAAATAPTSVPERSVATVTLDGSASWDPDGEPLTFAWAQVAGSPVELVGATTAMPSFALPEVAQDELFAFELVVSDGLDTSEPAHVEVLVLDVDRAPTVDAGTDLVVASRTAVTLQATGIDPDGDPLTWSWTQVAGPTVLLEDATSAMIRFEAPSVLAETHLEFEVTVAANGLRSSDTVRVTVQAEPMPVVDAGPDLRVPGRSLVFLTGSASAAASVRWEQVSGPLVELADFDKPTAFFYAPDVKEPAELVFRLRAESFGQVATDEMMVLVDADQPPVASVGGAIEAQAGSTVVLRATASDPEKDAISAQWRQRSGPEVVLDAADTLAPSFVAPDVREVTELRFELVVTANGLSSSPAEAVVRVHPVNRRPVVAGPNELEEDERTPITLVATIVDSDDDDLVFEWVQTGGPAVELEGAHTAAVSFVTPEVNVDTRLSFRLVARNAAGLASEPVVVTVMVRDVNQAPIARAVAVTGGAPGSMVVLDASSSVDPDGGALTFAWRQLQGTEVQLAGADTAVASFVAPSASGVLVFEVEVKDAAGATATQQVSVDVIAPKKKQVQKQEESGCSATGGSPVGGLLAVGALAWLRTRRRS